MLFVGLDIELEDTPLFYESGVSRVLASTSPDLSSGSRRWIARQTG